MGQARSRGTFDQRQSAAFEMIDRNYEAAKVAVADAEKEANTGRELISLFAKDSLSRFEKSGHPLLTVDFSQLERSMFSRGITGHVPTGFIHDGIGYETTAS